MRSHCFYQQLKEAAGGSPEHHFKREAMLSWSRVTPRRWDSKGDQERAWSAFAVIHVMCYWDRDPERGEVGTHRRNNRNSTGRIWTPSSCSKTKAGSTVLLDPALPISMCVSNSEGAADLFNLRKQEVVFVYALTMSTCVSALCFSGLWSFSVNLVFKQLFWSGVTKVTPLPLCLYFSSLFPQKSY